MGYGGIFPVTAVGKVLSGVIAILGIGLVAVPTGVISAGFIEQLGHSKKGEQHQHDVKCYCPFCGRKIDD